jgi:hypothetical protein
MYQYKESGLNNVYLENGYRVNKTPYEKPRSPMSPTVQCGTPCSEKSDNWKPPRM